MGLPTQRKQELQPIAPIRGAVIDKLSPCPHQPDARPSAAIGCFGWHGRLPGIERDSGVDEHHADPVRLADKRQLDLIRFSHSAVVIEVRHQLFDHNAKSREVTFGKPLRFPETVRRAGSEGDRTPAAEAAGKAVQFRVAPSHRSRYVTLPKRLGGLSCFAYL